MFFFFGRNYPKLFSESLSLKNSRRKEKKKKARSFGRFQEASNSACLTAKTPGCSRAGAVYVVRGVWGTNAGPEGENKSGRFFNFFDRLSGRPRCCSSFFLSSLTLTPFPPSPYPLNEKKKTGRSTSSSSCHWPRPRSTSRPTSTSSASSGEREERRR
jgi:hypothetical protein